MLRPELVGTHDALFDSQPQLVVSSSKNNTGVRRSQRDQSSIPKYIRCRPAYVVVGAFDPEFCMYVCLFWNEDSRLPVVGRRVFLVGEGANILGVPLKCVGVQRGLNPLR